MAPAARTRPAPVRLTARAGLSPARPRPSNSSAWRSGGRLPSAISAGAWAMAWVRAASFADHTARTVPCTASVGYPAITVAARSAAATAPPGSVTSLTSPTAYARSAPTRSAVPISAIRATSPNGIRWAIATASYAETIPYAVCGSKNVASRDATTNSASPSR
ncbi:hypothetical protein SCALM49S_02869 [Streptomyces californicus]